MNSAISSDFVSQGLKCSGRLHLPPGQTRPPVVIMAHGFAAETSFGLMPFADAFLEGGLAVFMFDYRHFAGSEGTPRNRVDPFRQLKDWEAAIGHVQTLPQVDASRIGIWGTSFSGGHVIVTAGRNPAVKAVSAQVPFVSGLASTLLEKPADILNGVRHGVKDLRRMVLGGQPHYVKAVGYPDEYAVLNTPESYPGYQALVPENAPDTNRVTASVLLEMPIYNPIFSARRIKCPALIIAARHDSLIPLWAVAATARLIPRCRLEILDCNHFAPYNGYFFAQTSRLELDFFRKHLI